MRLDEFDKSNFVIATRDMFDMLTEASVISSWIKSLDYNAEDEEVYMKTIKGKRTYILPNIDEETFEEWMNSSSKGTYWHDVIKWLL